MICSAAQSFPFSFGRLPNCSTFRLFIFSFVRLFNRSVSRRSDCTIFRLFCFACVHSFSSLLVRLFVCPAALLSICSVFQTFSGFSDFSSGKCKFRLSSADYANQLSPYNFSVDPFCHVPNCKALLWNWQQSVAGPPTSPGLNVVAIREAQNMSFLLPIYEPEVDFW
ncbi:unnamed protein product [Protopolystoma xenopodis]|uniref:Uncharacterized protein n=1 Tax=Protopolystoma xenopodis TaxID=117903 RepID=A0A3S5A229_9PLAT|nr:unnamed protein product [Protopolystoma xenopodis]